MTPHQGSGAGQAIEVSSVSAAHESRLIKMQDAYILAATLSHPKTTLHNLSHALKVYETIRLPLANSVLRRSNEMGKMYEFEDARFDDLAVQDPDVQRLRELGEELERNREWTWRTDLEPDRERAFRMLEDHEHVF